MPCTVISTGSHTTVSNYCDWFWNRETQVVTRLVVLLSCLFVYLHSHSSVQMTYTGGGVETSIQGVDPVMPRDAGCQTGGWTIDSSCTDGLGYQCILPSGP